MIRVLFASILFFCSSMLLKAQTIEISPVCFNTPENDFGIRKIGDKIYVVSADLKVNVTIKNRKSENFFLLSILIIYIKCQKESLVKLKVNLMKI